MSTFKDRVRISDAGFAGLRNRLGNWILGRKWEESDLDKPIIEVKGWVDAVLRENGKLVPGGSRNGFNIWTNTGRELLAMLMSIETAPGTKFRTDSIAYIGVGTGAQVENVNVSSLVDPVPYASGLFLAGVEAPATFPLNPTRTTVEFRRLFLEDEITLTPGEVSITELGLFTNGSPTATPIFDPGTRDTSISNASAQAPAAYKAFDPLPKTEALQFEVRWQIRF